MKNFHTHKDCKKIENFLTKFDNEIGLKLSKSEYLSYEKHQFVIGALSGIFLTNQDCKDKILSSGGQFSNYTKVAILISLIRTGVDLDIEKFKTQHSFNFKSENFQNIKNIKNTIPKYDSSINDLLIGAYHTTGDNLYIKNILQNFKTSNKNMVADAIRFAFIYSKFGNSPQYKKHFDNVNKSIINKYYKKEDPNPVLQTLTLSSAFWALQSLFEEDVNLAKYVKEFFLNSEFKEVFLAENTNFSNYMTSLVLDNMMIESLNSKNKQDAEKFNQELYEKNKRFILDYEALKEPRMFISELKDRLSNLKEHTYQISQ